MAFIIDKDGNYIPVFGETTGGGGGGTVNLWTSGVKSFYSNATLEPDTDNNTYKDYDVDLSELLPDDGAQYEVLFLLACSSGNIVVNSDVINALGGYVGTSDQKRPITCTSRHRSKNYIKGTRDVNRCVYELISV